VADGEPVEQSVDLIGSSASAQQLSAQTGADLLPLGVGQFVFVVEEGVYFAGEEVGEGVVLVGQFAYAFGFGLYCSAFVVAATVGECVFGYEFVGERLVWCFGDVDESVLFE
jgi:hypothetical protein